MASADEEKSFKPLLSEHNPNIHHTNSHVEGTLRLFVTGCSGYDREFDPEHRGVSKEHARNLVTDKFHSKGRPIVDSNLPMDQVARALAPNTPAEKAHIAIHLGDLQYPNMGHDELGRFYGIYTHDLATIAALKKKFSDQPLLLEKALNNLHLSAQHFRGIVGNHETNSEGHGVDAYDRDQNAERYCRRISGFPDGTPASLAVPATLKEKPDSGSGEASATGTLEGKSEDAPQPVITDEEGTEVDFEKPKNTIFNEAKKILFAAEDKLAELPLQFFSQEECLLLRDKAQNIDKKNALSTEIRHLATAAETPEPMLDGKFDQYEIAVLRHKNQCQQTSRIAQRFGSELIRDQQTGEPIAFHVYVDTNSMGTRAYKEETFFKEFYAALSGNDENPFLYFDAKLRAELKQIGKGCDINSIIRTNNAIIKKEAAPSGDSDPFPLALLTTLRATFQKRTQPNVEQENFIKAIDDILTGSTPPGWDPETCKAIRACKTKRIFGHHGPITSSSRVKKKEGEKYRQEHDIDHHRAVFQFFDGIMSRAGETKDGETTSRLSEFDYYCAHEHTSLYAEPGSSINSPLAKRLPKRLFISGAGGAIANNFDRFCAIPNSMHMGDSFGGHVVTSQNNGNQTVELKSIQLQGDDARLDEAHIIPASDPSGRSYKLTIEDGHVITFQCGSEDAKPLSQTLIDGLSPILYQQKDFRIMIENFVDALSVIPHPDMIAVILCAHINSGENKTRLNPLLETSKLDAINTSHTPDARPRTAGAAVSSGEETKTSTAQTTLEDSLNSLHSILLDDYKATSKAHDIAHRRITIYIQLISALIAVMDKNEITTMGDAANWLKLQTNIKFNQKINKSTTTDEEVDEDGEHAGLADATSGARYAAKNASTHSPVPAAQVEVHELHDLTPAFDPKDTANLAVKKQLALRHELASSFVQPDKHLTDASRFLFLILLNQYCSSPSQIQSLFSSLALTLNNNPVDPRCAALFRKRVIIDREPVFAGLYSLFQKAALTNLFSHPLMAQMITFAQEINPCTVIMHHLLNVAKRFEVNFFKSASWGTWLTSGHSQLVRYDQVKLLFDAIHAGTDQAAFTTMLQNEDYGVVKFIAVDDGNLTLAPRYSQHPVALALKMVHDFLPVPADILSPRADNLRLFVQGKTRSETPATAGIGEHMDSPLLVRTRTEP